MPKIKTNRGAAKRFRKTGTGKIRRNKAFTSHILTKKSTKRKRDLRQSTRSKLFRSATEAVDRALNYAFRDRRVRKRDFRALWITRINAAARENGLSYSRLIHGLKLADVGIDRKIMAQLAVVDPAGFGSIVEMAKTKLQ